mgnify:CR=1 FL=1
MQKPTGTITIGNVLRADIRSFVIASRIPEPDVPTFGTFVRVPIQQERAHSLGLVYNISLQDDPFLRHLAVTVDETNPQHREIIADQRERMIPVEISVAAIGYQDGEGTYHYGFPPQPPMVLKQITVCAPEEVIKITEQPDWMQPLLEIGEVPTDALIARALERSANLHGGEGSPQRDTYLVETLRYLARYLARDPLRLEAIVQQVYKNTRRRP